MLPDIRTLAIYGLAALLVASMGTACVERTGKLKARADLSDERRARAEETVDRERISRRATERNRQIEQERQAAANARERQKDETILNIDSRLRDALGELRDRPERPSGGGGTASQPSAQASCTGAGLYRADAGFLIGEAAAAARIAAERDYCYDRYDGLSAR